MLTSSDVCHHRCYHPTLKSSMSSSCREPAGDGVADSGCSGVSEWCLMFSPPRPNASSDWLIVESWLLPKRPWPMSPSWTSMVIGDELLKCEPLEFPNSYSVMRRKIHTQLLTAVTNNKHFITPNSVLCEGPQVDHSPVQKSSVRPPLQPGPLPQDSAAPGLETQNSQRWKRRKGHWPRLQGC